MIAQGRWSRIRVHVASAGGLMKELKMRISLRELRKPTIAHFNSVPYAVPSRNLSRPSGCVDTLNARSAGTSLAL